MQQIRNFNETKTNQCHKFPFNLTYIYITNCRCAVRLGIMKKKSSRSINTDANQSCLPGFGMKFDQESRLCTLGLVGKNMAGSHPSSPPHYTDVYMTDDAYVNYLKAGKKIKNSFL